MFKPLPFLRFTWAFLLCVLFAHNKILAQGNFVDVTAEIEKGKVYPICRVTAVTGSRVLFVPMGSNDTLYARVKSRIGNLIMERKISGSVPNVGDTALFVLDKNKRLKLAAKEYNETYYRFWSPARANVRFKYKRPAIPVPGFDEDIWMDKTNDYFTCEDGCLYPKSYLDADVRTAGLLGPREVHFNSLKRIGFKLSSMTPGIGFELKLHKRISFSSMAIQNVMYHSDRDTRSTFSSRMFAHNELRYYFYAIPDTMARKHSKYSGRYFS